jgi:hypothetical protein
MKSQLCPFVVLAIVLVMAAAYLGGTLVAAQGASAPAGPKAPPFTPQQWAAIEGASALLLFDDDQSMGYLPLVMK